ncbi:Uncharacterised protein [Bordetella pertussis]|nr:Uncharacterised protein [Bordetella pertussis]
MSAPARPTRPARCSLALTRGLAPLRMTRTPRRCRSVMTSSSACRPVMSMNGTQRRRMMSVRGSVCVAARARSKFSAAPKNSGPSTA